jgi:hypothetical protein
MIVAGVIIIGLIVPLLCLWSIVAAGSRMDDWQASFDDEEGL